jgi:flagellin-like hook-associated protein FlgL
MEVSTKLFNAQATKNFGKINEQIQDTQAKIASGKSFLKASDDPVTASNLSAKREQKILLDRFVKNGHTAKTRLDLADSGLNQVINVLTRCYTGSRNYKYPRCEWKEYFCRVQSSNKCFQPTP